MSSWNGTEGGSSVGASPESASGVLAVRTSRAQFDRVLMRWASDLLSLRSRGLDVPGRRRLESERAAVVGRAA